MVISAETVCVINDKTALAKTVPFYKFYIFQINYKLWLDKIFFFVNVNLQILTKQVKMVNIVHL